MIKNDEILLIKTILKHCEGRYDPLHRRSIDKLDMNYKRLQYLLHKMCNNELLNYGTNIYFGWIDKEPSEIIEFYKKRGVVLEMTEEKKKHLSMGFGISRLDELWTDLPWTIIDVEKLKDDNKGQTE